MLDQQTSGETSEASRPSRRGESAATERATTRDVGCHDLEEETEQIPRQLEAKFKKLHADATRVRGCLSST
jgi:hypothetical protein